MIGDPYATLADLKSRLAIGDTVDDVELTDALATASREVEARTGRQFNAAAAASMRTYRVATPWWVDIDDAVTVDAVTVDGRTWVVGVDYNLAPLNGVVDGVPGWPVSRLTATGARCMPGGGTVAVTAVWGWTAVPAPVREATLVVAQEVANLKDAPFGIKGGDEFGAVRIGKVSPRVVAMLAPYVRYPVLVA